ncbi:CoaE-domain-containing protein [Piptocephalis cylindrospora]|uniref:CoaE-domain-containing protein n=1 Tax=Piptocephalis cylindrospora TaxID=1907219 RepID=A0A4P9Y1K9_9FUNG|nr:CoaE-domain-containing protein [Piptocephalis cylindrospora]|eukprot:RKP11700.1 CoaE-domain-containing protein [Piptocephalis cylindrospora]
MLLIGLTGGIAMGKSTASKALGEWVPVVDADVVAREVVEPGEAAYKEIVEYFGQDILGPDGKSLDRAALGRRVFADPEARRVLNGMTHPRIRRRMLRRVLGHYLQGARACVLDVPLLFEAGLDALCGVVIVVHCDAEKQMERLRTRDELDEEMARSKIAAQMAPEDRLRGADLILDTSDLTVEGTRERTRSWIVPGGSQSILPSVWWVRVCRFIPPIALISALWTLLSRRWRRF